MAQDKAATTARICAFLAGALLLWMPASCLAQGVAPTPPQQAEPAATPPSAADQNKTGAPAKTAPAPGASSNELDGVLAQMDKASAHFKSAQADVELTQYTAVVKEKDVQTGRIYFRRRGHDTEVALWIEKPHPKQAVVKGDKVIFFDPRTRQVTERDLGSNKQDVEAVMNLGFGGRGSDLLKEYNVTMDGWENVDGIRAAKLELVAKSESLRRLFTKLVLWVDPARSVALQQQRFESSGDYQLTHYTNINLSSNIPDDRFVIKK